MASPTAAVLSATGRQYVRQPVNIALLLVLPPLFVLALGSTMSTFSDVLGGNIGERAASALGALWAAALLGGSAAFFLISSARRADQRLLIAGLSVGALAAAHAVGAAFIAIATGSIGFAFAVATQDIASPFDLWAAVVLAALAYEALGIALAFIVRGDLEGSFVIILVFMVDAFVAGPLGGASGLWPNLFPLHHPSQLAIDAVAGPGVDRALYGWSIGYTALLLGIATAAHARALR